MIEPPTKPSELLRLALNDLIKCEKDPRYTINMLYWHFNDSNTCYVCLAGSVMAKTLKVSSRYIEELYPVSMPLAWRNPLRAINFFRVGCVAAGCDALEIKCTTPESNPISYHLNQEEFKQSILKLINDFEAEEQ